MHKDDGESETHGEEEAEDDGDDDEEGRGAVLHVSRAPPPIIKSRSQAPAAQHTATALQGTRTGGACAYPPTIQNGNPEAHTAASSRRDAQPPARGSRGTKPRVTSVFKSESSHNRQRQATSEQQQPQGRRLEGQWGRGGVRINFDKDTYGFGGEHDDYHEEGGGSFMGRDIVDLGGGVPHPKVKFVKPSVEKKPISVVEDVHESCEEDSFQPIPPPRFHQGAFPVPTHRSMKTPQVAEPSTPTVIQLPRAPSHSPIQLQPTQPPPLSSGPIAAPSTTPHSQSETPSAARFVGGVNMDEIEQESSQRLQNMSAEEILAAQEEIHRLLDPSLVQLLKRRGARRNANENPSTPTASSLSSAEQLPEMLSPQPSRELLTTPIETSLALPNDPPVDMSKETEWMSEVMPPKNLNPSTGPVPAELARFDFTGNLIPPGTDVPVSAGLHHHGDDQWSAGYRLSDIHMLVRSSVGTQRIIALKTLSCIFAAHRCSTKQPPLVLEFLDHVLSLKFPLLLRICINDENQNIVEGSILALRNLLVDSEEETLLEQYELMCRGLECPLNPQFPEAIDAVLKKNVGKHSGDDGEFGQEDSSEDDEDQDEAEIASKDVIAALISTDIYHKLVELLNSAKEAILTPTLDILLKLIRHSVPSAVLLAKTPGLLPTFTSLCSSEIDEVLMKTLRILRTLCCLNREATTALLSSSGLILKMRPRVASVGAENSLVQYLKLVQVCVCYGFDFSDLHLEEFLSSSSWRVVTATLDCAACSVNTKGSLHCVDNLFAPAWVKANSVILESITENSQVPTGALFGLVSSCLNFLVMCGKVTKETPRLLCSLTKNMHLRRHYAAYWPREAIALGMGYNHEFMSPSFRFAEITAHVLFAQRVTMHQSTPGHPSIRLFLLMKPYFQPFDTKRKTLFLKRPLLWLQTEIIRLLKEFQHMKKRVAFLYTSALDLVDKFTTGDEMLLESILVSVVLNPHFLNAAYEPLAEDVVDLESICQSLLVFLKFYFLCDVDVGNSLGLFSLHPHGNFAVPLNKTTIPLPTDWYLLPVSHQVDQAGVWLRSKGSEIPSLAVKNCLLFLYVMEKLGIPGITQSTPLGLKVYRLMQTVLAGEAFEHCSDTLNLLFECYDANIPKNEETLLLPLPVPPEPHINFQSVCPLFTVFITELAVKFAADSFGNRVWAKLLLLLLRMEYPAEYRRILLTELHDIIYLRILLTELHDIIYLLALPSFPLGRPGYFFPTETSPEVISLWNQLLLKGKLSRRRGTSLYWLAVHHLCTHLFKEHGRNLQSLLDLLNQGSKELCADVLGYSYPQDTPNPKQPQLYTTGTSAGARGFSPECSQLLLGHCSPLIMQITARLAVLFPQE
ncbi:RNA polymerase II-associated protein 1 [Pelomyxa schiedti]|nr:RNA polymerase II-associated protein 1 [Pelomyxa schiedti]